MKETAQDLERTDSPRFQNDRPAPAKDDGTPRLYRFDAASCGLPYHGVYEIIPKSAEESGEANVCCNPEEQKAAEERPGALDEACNGGCVCAHDFANCGDASKVRGYMVAPVAFEREVKWVAPAMDNVGICGKKDVSPGGMNVFDKISLQNQEKMCCVDGNEDDPNPDHKKRKYTTCCALPLNTADSEHALEDGYQEQEKKNLVPGIFEGAAGMPERLRLFFNLPWEKLDVKAPPPTGKQTKLGVGATCQPLHEWAEEQAARNVGAEKGDLKYEWQCQVKARCQAVLESRSGIRGRSPPLGCLSKQQSEAVTEETAGPSHDKITKGVMKMPAATNSFEMELAPKPKKAPRRGWEAPQGADQWDAEERGRADGFGFSKMWRAAPKPPKGMGTHPSRSKESLGNRRRCVTTATPPRSGSRSPARAATLVAPSSRTWRARRRRRRRRVRFVHAAR